MSPASNLRKQHAVVAATNELWAQEKLARLLCRHIQHLVVDARARGALQSREARLQAEVFAERHEQVMRLLGTATTAQIDEPRMARLEQLIAALEFSRSYFRKAK